jgi:hypothetical protein
VNSGDAISADRVASGAVNSLMIRLELPSTLRSFTPLCCPSYRSANLPGEPQSWCGDHGRQGSMNMVLLMSTVHH